jgi:hypothetical protein
MILKERKKGEKTLYSYVVLIVRIGGSQFTMTWNFRCFKVNLYYYFEVNGRSQVLFVVLIVPTNNYITSHYNKDIWKKICM